MCFKKLLLLLARKETSLQKAENGRDPSWKVAVPPGGRERANDQDWVICWMCVLGCWEEVKVTSRFPVWTSWWERARLSVGADELSF